LKVRDWLQKSSRSLSGMVMKIEEFVEQKNCLDIINKEFPAKKEEIYLLESLQNLLVEKNIEQFDKEDKEL
jgi:dynein heavy chain